jgi:Tol biopolymer transport system component
MLFVTSVAAVAVAVAALAGLDAIRASEPRPADPGPRPGPRIDWASVPTMSVDQDSIVDIRTGRVDPLPAGLRSFHKLGGYAVAPTSEAVLFEGSIESQPTTGMLYVAALDGSDLRRVHTAPWGATTLTKGAWSPDGTKIAALAGDGVRPNASRSAEVDLVLIDAATGQTRVLARGGRGDFEQPTFSPDGDRILFSRFANRPFRWDLYQVPVDGGNISLVRQGGGYATFSPDGRTMVFRRFLTISPGRNSFTSGPELWLANADGSEPHRLEDGTFSDNPTWSPDGSRLAYSRYNEVRRGIVIIDMQSGTPTLVVQAGGTPVGVWLDNNHILIDRT